MEEREYEARVPATESKDDGSESFELREEEVVCGYSRKECCLFVHCRCICCFHDHGNWISDARVSNSGSVDVGDGDHDRRGRGDGERTREYASPVRSRITCGDRALE